jgi:hypothetical protein
MMFGLLISYTLIQNNTKIRKYEIAINKKFAQAIENASPVRLCLGSSNTDENKIDEINTHD